MKNRLFGSDGPPVSEIGLGCWQLGGADWGDVSEDDAFEILQTAVDAGITFIDTADVYGMGRSESLIGRFLEARGKRDDLFIATKIGRRPEAGFPGTFEKDVMRAHIEDCLEHLKADNLDLVQLHCIGEGELEKGEVFEHLREFRSEGLIKRFGASVETVSQAKYALTAEGLSSLQLIFNMLRQTMADEILPAAHDQGVAIIVRLPLASGLLAGKYKPGQKFAENDHRNFNRDGEAFYVGETFAGLPFDTGLDFVERLRPVLPQDCSMADAAQRWVLDHPAVTTVITGASSADQVRANAKVSRLDPLDDALHEELKAFYSREIMGKIRGEI
ncbi:aldo/keto reductase [Parvularcula flava]|uniref:Aldo/keto reductase n=1 Tax=Aquisalinus luteolus TaxID=1566827 RepID=A0A8J3A3M8_9PROT|nr:aldo/keto reductase [Aquisalinus luteolus]NHK28170.1 aldo/keto reductase [Aquisalinus luteolus]GGH97675.1 oxidoreductase [Aquisalinus luteolus]